MLLRWFEHGQVYHPDKVLDLIESKRAESFEDIWFKAQDGISLNGWFFAAPASSPTAIELKIPSDDLPGSSPSPPVEERAGERRPFNPERSNSTAAAGPPRKDLVVLLCHGNAGNISGRVDLCQIFTRMGLNVFQFDYRGYGRSEGKPSEEGTYLDAEAAVKWLETKGFSSTNIIAFGESLGGGIASELALRIPLAGIVLQNTFTSIPDIGSDLFPWMPVRLMATIKYDTRSKLPRIDIPVMVIHSRADGLAGFHHAEKNFAAANEPKLFWETHGEHNELLLDRPHFIEGMERFLEMVEAYRKAAAAQRALERNSNPQPPTSREAPNPKP